MNFVRADTRPSSLFFSTVVEDPKPQAFEFSLRSCLLYDRVEGAVTAVLVIGYRIQRRWRRLEVRLGERRVGRGGVRLRGPSRYLSLRWLQATGAVLGVARSSAGLHGAGSELEAIFLRAWDCKALSLILVVVPLPPASERFIWRRYCAAATGSLFPRRERGACPFVGRFCPKARDGLCFDAHRRVGVGIHGPLARPTKVNGNVEKVIRAILSFANLTRCVSHVLSLSNQGHFHFKTNIPGYCGIRPKFSSFKLYYSAFFGSEFALGHWKPGGSSNVTATRFWWDPGGPGQVFKLWWISLHYRVKISLATSVDQWLNIYRLSFLGWVDTIGFDKPGLGEGSVNSFSFHIWDTVGNALIRANAFALEACLWIELSGMNTVHPGKSLWLYRFLQYRSGVIFF